jgi:hypothetical protein
MKTYALLLAAICCIVLFSFPVSAQQRSPPAKEELIKKLISAAHTEEFTGVLFTALMNAYIDLMPKADESSSAFADASPALRLELLKLLNDTTRTIAEQSKRRIIEDQALKVLKLKVATEYWDQNFSEAELRQLLDFMSSPLGQKLNSTYTVFLNGATQKIGEAAKARVDLIFQEVKQEEMQKALNKVRELEHKYKSTKQNAKPN